jgi:hypothetical protein
MRCKDVEVILYDAESVILAETVREHLKACPHCADTWKELRLLRAGFNVMAQDPVPEAMLGFSARVVRRLESAVDANRSAAEFIERVGRRFVLASLLLTMSFLLALALPSSGPLRGPSKDEPYIVQPEQNLSTEVTVLGDDYSDTRTVNPVKSTNGSEQKQK